MMFVQTVAACSVAVQVGASALSARAPASSWTAAVDEHAIVIARAAT
jgi:hypothetical protein